jgi:hypothetical protein
MLTCCDLGTRRHRLGGAGEELQRGVWIRPLSGWVYHLKVRHGWRHGWHSGQHRPRDKRTSALRWSRSALFRPEEFLGQVGRGEASKQHLMQLQVEIYRIAVIIRLRNSIGFELCRCLVNALQSKSDILGVRVILNCQSYHVTTRKLSSQNPAIRRVLNLGIAANDQLLLPLVVFAPHNQPNMLRTNGSGKLRQNG